jgi:hypothetical protein
MPCSPAVDRATRAPRALLGFLRALILALALVAPALHAQRAAAQGGPQMVPGPLTTKRLERLLKVYVDPSPAEASAIDEAHAGYLERFRAELDPEIRALSGSMGGGMPSRQDLDRFLRDSARLGAKVGEADAAFLAAAASMVPESRRAGFDRIREARERQRAISGLARMAPMMFGGGGSFVDLADLLTRDQIVRAVPLDRRADFDAFLRQQEVRTLGQARTYGETVRKSMGDLLEDMVAMQTEMMAEAEAAVAAGADAGNADADAAAAAQARMASSMQRMMEVMRSHGAAPRKQIAANFAANKAALPQFAGIIPEAALLDLRIDLATRSVGMSRFMMGGMGGGGEADPRALARRLQRDTSLPPEVLAALPAILDRWRREHAATLERGAELSLDLDPSALMSFAPGAGAPDAATQAKVEELRDVTAKVDEASRRALEEIAQILGDASSRYLNKYETGDDGFGGAAGGTTRYLVVTPTESEEERPEDAEGAMDIMALSTMLGTPPPPSEPGLLRVLGLFGVDEGQNEVIRVILEDWRAREWTPRVEPIGARLQAAWSKSAESQGDAAPWSELAAIRRELAAAVLAADAALCADLAPALGFADQGPEMLAFRLERLALLQPTQSFGGAEVMRLTSPAQIVLAARVDAAVGADVFRKSAESWSALIAELPALLEKEIERQRELDALSRTWSSGSSGGYDMEEARRAGERYGAMMREGMRAGAELAKRINGTLDAAIAAATESEAARVQLRRMRLELAHPVIYRRSDNASHQIEAALRVPDLEPAARTRLEALAADYAAAHAALSEQLVALSQPAPGMGESDWREYQRVAEEAGNTRFQRNERTEKARAEVRRILGDERAARIRGLVPDEDAAARARRERGFDPFADEDD